MLWSGACRRSLDRSDANNSHAGEQVSKDEDSVQKDREEALKVNPLVGKTVADLKALLKEAGLKVRALSPYDNLAYVRNEIIENMNLYSL